MFKVLTTTEKGDVVVIFIKVIMERNDVNGHMGSQFFSHILEHEDVSIVPVGIHEISVEVGNVELIGVITIF
ncbi:Uncharacterised protein [Streptococcus pneumoniae]|nr:Uncharacterised protein [Streptococcus pneumoniae]CIV93805.1 Uncharacterised protein [Streptococcus pneumoniae]